MKKITTFFLFLFLTVMGFSQQLRNWPVYSFHSSMPVLSDLAYTSGSPPGYNYNVNMYTPPPSIPPPGIAEKVVCSNAYYDNKNNLIFYVYQTDGECNGAYKVYIYDQGHNLIPNCVDLHATCTNTPYTTIAPLTTEINIIPVPSCEENAFHIIVGNQLIVLDLRDPAAGKRVVHQAALPGAGIRMNSGGAVHAIRTTPSAIWIKDRNSYFVYAFANNDPGGLVGTLLTKTEIKLMVCSELYKCELGDYRYPVGSSPYIKQAPTYVTLGFGGIFSPYSGQFTTQISELELSADGKHLLFNDMNKVMVLNFSNANDADIANSLVSHQLYDIPPSGLGNSYAVSGLEFDKNLQYVYYTIYNVTSSQPSNALIQVNLTSGVTTPIPGTQQYARSQLETGMDDNIYMLWSGGIDYIDHLTNSVTPYLDFNAPGGPGGNVLLNGSPYNATLGGNMELYTLPDQIDGQSFENGYFGNPIVNTYQYTICNPDELWLKIGMPECNRTSESTAVWYVCTNHSTENYECVYEPAGVGGAYHVSGTTLTKNGGLSYKAEYTDAFGCSYIDFFNISAPSYTKEVIDKYVCYGEPLEIVNPCSDGNMSWFEEELTDLYTSSATAYGGNYTLPNLQSDLTVTAICWGANNCATSMIIYRIHVAPQPTSTVISAEACVGEAVNIRNLLPTGCREQFPPLIDIITAAQSYSYVCKDAHGCPVNSITVNVNALPTTVNEQYIEVSCGTMIDLNAYNCSTSDNKWYVEDPDNIGQYTEAAGTLFVVGQNTTFLCEGKNPCCRLTLHVSLLAPEHNLVHIEACEGDLIDVASHLPLGCSWAGPIPPVLATTSQVLNYPCIDEYFGCIRSYTDIVITVKPSSFREETVTVNCGTMVDLNNLFGHVVFCDGGVRWATKDGNNYLQVLSPVFAATHSQTYYGFGLTNPCCRVVIHIEIVQPLEEVYYLCDDQVDFQSSDAICGPGSTAEWTKNGIPYTWTGNFSGNGDYRLKCIDDVTGCVKRSVLFHVDMSENCDVVFVCVGSGVTLTTPCVELTTEWTMNGNPYSGSGDITVTMPGVYEVMCKDAQGNIIYRKRYFVFPCGFWSAQSPEMIASGIKPLLKEDQVTVFPNPFSNHVTIQLKDVAAERMDVIDVLGRLVYKQDTKDLKNMILDTKDWATGTYIIRLYQNNELVKIQKMLKAE